MINQVGANLHSHAPFQTADLSWIIYGTSQLNSSQLDSIKLRINSVRLNAANRQLETDSF